MFHGQAANRCHDPARPGVSRAARSTILAIETEPDVGIGQQSVHFTQLQKRHLAPREQGAVGFGKIDSSPCRRRTAGRTSASSRRRNTR